MFMSLLGSRRFAPMFICQFFSALNDNFIKTALAILILFKIGAEDGAVLVSLAGATLVAPFFFLSALGGEIADRFDKARVATWIKTAEIPVAMLAAAGFMLSSVPMLFAALFGFGVMAALFGPIKYGILPDHLETRELPAANALMEGATFAAILCGTIAGGLALSGASAGEQSLIPSRAVALIIVAFAGVGLASARAILPTGAAMPTLRITRNPLASTWRQLGELNADRRLWHGGLITSWFWMAGIVVISLFPSLVRDVIGGTENVATAGLAIFTIGIAVGSWAAARASHLRPNLALVPLGALLMGAFALYAAYAVASLPPAQANGAPVDLARLMATAAGQNLAAAFFGLSAAGGLFVVPAFAAVQAWAPPNHRARTIAAVNILNALFMTTGTLTLALAQSYGVTAQAVLITIGVASALVAIWVVRVWGRDALKDLAYAVFKTFYGLEVKGRDNLPKPGARAIITPNHVSFLDGPIMHAITPDHAAFAIDTTIAEAWWVRPFMRFISAFTLDPTQPLATRHLVHAVEQGNTLVIFPEGRLTTTGGLMKVYDGTALIADHADAEIIPVRITGAERSPWSYLRRSQTRKRIFPKITVEILPARKIALDATLKGKARRAAAGAALQDIMVETAVETADTGRTLFEALCDAKRTGDTGKPAVADPTGVSLSYGKLIAGAQALGHKLTAFTAPGEAVGVFLPNAAGTVVTFFALQSAGRVPAMLNFTAGLKNIVSACRTAKITTVLTSRSFVEKGHFEDLIAGLPGDIRVVYLDELRETITTTDKLRAVTRGSAPIARRAADDPAVILFTSGSEGAPKAVVLSHRNILANALQALTFVSADGEDKVFNVLPVFHAFGLTAGLIMPLVGGIPVYLYPSPLHYRIVPELVYQTNATILFGTDTFLNGYARTAHPYDFHRLRLIVAGAEAVKPRTRDLYMEQFGTRILEGYGVTEAAPVIAINTPLANRIGTVGRFVPLLETRLDPVPGIDDGGRLFVRGPNVMLGYMRAEAPGVIEPPPSGWHDTGDIISVDGDGFVTIRGRAKRFAKVGGEIVSLAAAESLAEAVWPNNTTVVLTEPDARKGERLVALTTHERAERQDLVAAGRSSGTSELMIPAEIVVVASIPVLGSGKVDHRGAADLLKTLRAGAATHAAGDSNETDATSAGDISPVTA